MSATAEIPQAFNSGWVYRERIPPQQAGLSVSCFYATLYRHTDRQGWQRRLAAGEIHRNGIRLLSDEPLEAGDRLAWHRPPWPEPSVPATWRVIFDDGDLYVIDKPSGLPVLPAGGFLEHTVLRLLERHVRRGPVPRPVHRLGRFTSGLLVCARKHATRSWLSARLRTCTRRGSQALTSPPAAVDDPSAEGSWGKTYLALLLPGRISLSPGESQMITTPIGLRPHPLLGDIWCAGGDCSSHGQGAEPLPALSRITLLARGREADLVEVQIATGRPHQIRIHCAALGAPLLGDPLYLPGGLARADGLPGEGGYRLHAYKLDLCLPGGTSLHLCAPPPAGLAPGRSATKANPSTPPHGICRESARPV